MTTLPISSFAAYSSSPGLNKPASNQPSNTSSADNSSSSDSSQQATNLASQNVFLQLLVAQLKNQDPEQPTDGTAFVTELAQFTTLQEDTNSSTDLDKIVAALPSLTAAAEGTTKTNTQ